MSTLKVIGLLAGGMCLAALIGGGVFLWRKRKKESGDTPKKPQRVKPSKPPRGEVDDDSSTPKHSASGHFVGKADLGDELTAILDEEFGMGWPADDPTIDSLEQDDVIVFAVESEPVGPYTGVRKELINARVLSVEKTVVRGRVMGPVAHVEHHGSHAGHAFRVGDLVEVPRSKVLVAARPGGPEKVGYDSEGEAERTFKPSDLTGETYRVKPQTPYDLDLPYRTEHLEWHVNKKLVNVVHIGHKATFEQIKFTEDSLRGEVSVRALDHDPELGVVFVGRWDFVIEA